MIIREAKKSDLKDIGRLNMELDRRESRWWPYAVISQKKSMNWLKSKLRNENGKIFLAIEDGKAIGFIFGWIGKSDYHTRIKKWGYLSSIYVLSEYRKKGVGKALTKKLVEWFGKKKMKYVNLWAFWQNDSGRKFWESLGFDEYGIFMKKKIK